MSIFANSEDTDEMQHDAAFYQGLHFLLRSKQTHLCRMEFPIVINCTSPFLF